MITGAEMVVKALIAEKVDTLFAYPGGQAIDLFHALYRQDNINLILPRHEQGLIHAADGYARSTKKVGVCLVTSGPGATNLVTGIATANYDSVPLVCFTGQVLTELIGKDAFQEVDTVSITKSICKYAVTVRKREDLAAIIKKAFFIAQDKKPGVVVVDIPKDIQREYGSEIYPKRCNFSDDRPNSAILMRQLDKAVNILVKAKKPVFLVGGGVNISNAQAEMLKLAEQTKVPVITTIMGKGAIPTNHALYVGNIGIHGSYAANTAISQCDVLFSIGTRFNDRITGKIEQFAALATIIHLDIDAATISKNIKADIPIVTDAKIALDILLKKTKPLQIDAWTKQITEWQRQHPMMMKSNGLTPQKIIEQINKAFDTAIIVTDVGQNQLWATQFLELNEHKRMLTSGGLGTMGYGFPAALGAKIGNPKENVIVITGDGGMQMNIQEMATAVCYELPVIICILNNGYLGNVRQWQEMFYNRAYVGTCLQYRKTCQSGCNQPSQACPAYTPNFLKLAESYGARAIQVTNEAEIAAALTMAKNTKKVPTILEFIIAREANVLPIIPPGNALADMVLAEDV